MKNNVIIITGATSMIGTTAAYLLAEQGAKVEFKGLVWWAVTGSNHGPAE